MNIQANGISLFYEVSGKGTPLVLLHGNGEDHHIFDCLSNQLKTSFTVYALDSRNHGQSEKTNDFSYETMAKDLCLFIENLGLEKVDLLGFSDGAITGLMAASKQPERFHKMALLGVNLKPSDFTPENYQALKTAYAESKDPLLKLMLEQPNIELASVKHIQIPTLLIGAENDLFKPTMFYDLAAAMPKAQLKIMEGHEHDTYIKDTDILYPELLRFFTD